MSYGHCDWRIICLIPLFARDKLHLSYYVIVCRGQDGLPGERSAYETKEYFLLT